MVMGTELLLVVGWRDGGTTSRWFTIVFTYEYSKTSSDDVALIDGKPELLSTFAYIYEALGIESDEEHEFRQEALVL